MLLIVLIILGVGSIVLCFMAVGAMAKSHEADLEKEKERKAKTAFFERIRETQRPLNLEEYKEIFPRCCPNCFGRTFDCLVEHFSYTDDTGNYVTQGSVCTSYSMTNSCCRCGTVNNLYIEPHKILARDTPIPPTIARDPGAEGSKTFKIRYRSPFYIRDECDAIPDWPWQPPAVAGSKEI